MPDGTAELVELDSQALEEVRRHVAEQEARAVGDAPLSSVPPEVTRKMRAEGRGAYPKPVVLAEGTDRSLPGRAGEIPLRVFTNETGRGVYLHIHGGGWVLGSHAEQDPLLFELARGAGVTVVSVGYRLAPEHPFPAGPDDCEDAACYLIEHAEEFGGGQLLIGGESAGANLAVLTLLRLRDRHSSTGAFRAANLSYGVFDLSMTPSQLLWGTRNAVLNTEMMAWFARCFAGERRLDDPEISPLYADLSSMPPALFSCGTDDPLIDDSLFMAARWRRAGAPSELELYESTPHGFLRQPLRVAEVARNRQIAYLRGALEA